MATALPPGFRFHPTDVELICYYLKRKLMGKTFQFEAISEVELYKFAPWHLPEKSRLHTKDREWYFFCTRGKKYPKGSRTNRSSDIGYWKTTGKDRSITHNSRTVGMKKTLIFHVGKPPKGDRTDWVMYEYKMDDKKLIDTRILQDYVLCKIFQKSGPGPKIGEQYGAPFSEEDWEEDPAECSLSIPHLSSPRSTTIEPESVHPACEQAINRVEYDDCIDLDGMLLADLEELLDAPLSKNNITETSDYVHIDNADALYSEFKDLTASQMIIAGSDNGHTLCNEYPLLPMLSELNNDQYVELKDLCFPGELVPCQIVEQWVFNLSSSSAVFW